ncbi:MAG: permease [Armatimonadota bacterium]
MQQEQTPQTTESGLECRRPRKPWVAVGVFTLIAIALAFLLLNRQLAEHLLQLLPGRPKEALVGIVDVFSCCILTWKAFTTMLPTFLLGGAIATFAPTGLILRYLGARSNQTRAYATAALCGPLLSLCSCNIVPLFASIYRRGAGIGPAFTFLFAGPAINILALVFTFQVIGFKIGIARAIAVPIIAVAIGLTMSFLYRKEQKAALAQQQAVAAAGPAHLSGRLWALFGTLAASVLFGAWEMPWPIKIGGTALFAVALIVIARKLFDADERGQWLRESWGLIKLVIPVLIPSIFLIGLLSYYIDVKLVYRLVGAPLEGSGLWGIIRPVLTADLFGEIMYFPLLSEVAFTKAFLKLGMTVGPALALLITGPGTSLPGAIIVGRAIGWKKALVFELLCITFTAIFALLFVGQIGQYICACMMGPH